MADTEWREPYWVKPPPTYHLREAGKPWSQLVKKTKHHKKSMFNTRDWGIIESWGNSFIEYEKLRDDSNSAETDYDHLQVGFICEFDVQRYYYVVVNEVVGASRGKETNLLKIKRGPSGESHAYPISEDELVAELRKHRPQELERYNRRWKR